MTMNIDDHNRNEDATRGTWSAGERARAEETSRDNEAWAAGQKEAFKAALNSAPLERSLGILVRIAIEQMGADLRCAFYIVDATGTGLKHVTGMPEPYALCVDGFKIGPDSLACGLAVYTGKPVITPDVTQEPKWAEWLWLAEQYGYRACWSFPVETSTGKVVGTFAMYFSSPREASSREHRLAGLLTQAASIIIGRQQEIEERTRAEMSVRATAEYQRLLLAELQHRVRNILASVRAIAGRTVSSVGSIDDFKAHFDGRIAALARTQSVLTRSPGDGVDLELLVRDELLAQAAQDVQYTLSGPALRLPPKAAEVTALALHELATNANKYGALAQPRGHIDISWRSEDRGEQPWLTLSWTERGVPLPDGAPKHEGFGTELMTRRIPYELQGTGAIVFTSTGVHAEIAFPLPEAHELVAARARSQRAAE
jgi:two-component sensor histidine kinase